MTSHKPSPPCARRFTILVPLALLVLHIQACTSWRPVTVSPREFIEEDQPSAVRVTRADGAALVVPNPIVVNDSIQCRLTVGVTCRARLLALDDVQVLETRRPSAPRTALLIGAVLGLASLISTLADGVFGFGS